MEMYSVKQIAEACGVSKPGVRNWLKAENVPYSVDQYTGAQVLEEKEAVALVQRHGGSVEVLINSTKKRKVEIKAANERKEQESNTGEESANSDKEPDKNGNEGQGDSRATDGAESRGKSEQQQERTGKKKAENDAYIRVLYERIDDLKEQLEAERAHARRAEDRADELTKTVDKLATVNAKLAADNERLKLEAHPEPEEGTATVIDAEEKPRRGLFGIFHRKN